MMRLALEQAIGRTAAEAVVEVFGEPVTAKLIAKQGKRKVSSGKKSIPATTRKLTLSIPGKFRSGSLSLNVSLADAAGNKGSHQSILFVPAIRKKH